MNLMIFDLYSVVSNFTVNLAHDIIGIVSDGYSFCVACVCGHCCRTNHHRLRMNFICLVSCVSDAISFYRIFMYLMELLSSNKSDSLDDESDDDGSDSGSAGTCAFFFSLW